MKKVIVILLIFSLVFISFFLFKKEEEKENENISIIIETNEGHIAASTYPDKEYYEYSNINCKNTSDNIYVNFNKETWKLNLSVEEEKVDGNFNCIVHFKQRNRLGTEVITSKYKENNTEGLIKLNQPETEQTPALVEYRYSGSNNEVKNYVEFNNEIWRIIGVSPVDDGTGKYEDRIKIVREESIGEYSWDTSEKGINDYTDTAGNYYNGAGINQWGESGDYEGADLMRLLNPGYENESINNSLYWNRESGTCFIDGYYTEAKTTSCNFSSTGLTSDAKSMIDDAKWYASAVDQSGVTALISYQQERGNRTGIADVGITVKKTINWVGKVGLIYESDYAYASSECYKDVYLYDSNNGQDYSLKKCTSSNWILNDKYIVMFNPTSWSYCVIRRSFPSGVVGSGLTRNSTSQSIRPAVYLKENIKITGGNGTIENPYKVEI